MEEYDIRYNKYRDLEWRETKRGHEVRKLPLRHAGFRRFKRRI